MNKDLFLCEPQACHQEWLALWCCYHVICDDYDARILTWDNGVDGRQSMNERERARVNLHSAVVRGVIKDIANIIPPDNWENERRYALSLSKGQQHEMAMANHLLLAVKSKVNEIMRGVKFSTY